MDTLSISLYPVEVDATICVEYSIRTRRNGCTCVKSGSRSKAAVQTVLQCVARQRLGRGMGLQRETGE